MNFSVVKDVLNMKKQFRMALASPIDRKFWFPKKYSSRININLLIK